MSQFQQPIRLGESDLYSARVEAYLEEQAVLSRGMPDIEPQPLILRVIFSSYFYLSIASGLGAFTAWAIMEPFINDGPHEERDLVGIFLFPLVAGFIGLFLGATEGIMCRNIQRAVVCAAVGLGIGFVGGLVILIPTGILYTVTETIAASLAKPGVNAGRPTGLAFLVHMMGRSIAWSIVSIPAGLGQGIALREKKVVMNGLLGAVLGGLIGGLLFDPIALAFTGPNGQADLSRCVGFSLIGLMVGLFVGMIEQWTKTAWLLMRAGPLAGKQFIIYRNPTVLGSSPKADIYLFKDEAIEPQHALVHNFGGRYEIEDKDTADGTYVNGIPVTKQILKPGDQIVLGKTVLEFALKETS